MGDRLTWMGLVAAALLACVADEDLPKPSTFGGSAHPTTSPSSGDPATETGMGSETAGSESGGETGPEPECDPLGDPELECGPLQRCEFETLTCVPAEGTGLVDAACLEVDDCSPGLVCFDGFCAAPCDPALDDPSACEIGLVCAYAEDPVPGACLRTCSLLAQDCGTFGQACKRGLGLGDEPLAVCVANPGAGLEGAACEVDGDCDDLFLCTPSGLHSAACAGGAAACCVAICDDFERPCALFSFEPVCEPLLIEGQAGAGYCRSA